MKYRVENKYLITEKQISFLKEKLKYFMQEDKNMNGDSYLVRSLYFDDRFNSCLYDNESGIDRREKFRIRTYNNNKELIHLEQKSKYHGYTNKLSENITIKDVESYLNFEPPDMQIKDGFLKRKLYVQMKTRLLRPVHIIEYERTAFVEPMGNVRITFDRNICGSNMISNFFEDVLSFAPVLPQGQHILEIKYDEFLPNYIRQTIDTGELQRTAFSKYYYARINERNTI